MVVTVPDCVHYLIYSMTDCIVETCLLNITKLFLITILSLVIIMNCTYDRGEESRLLVLPMRSRIIAIAKDLPHNNVHTET